MENNTIYKLTAKGKYRVEELDDCVILRTGVTTMGAILQEIDCGWREHDKIYEEVLFFRGEALSKEMFDEDIEVLLSLGLIEIEEV